MLARTLKIGPIALHEPRRLHFFHLCTFYSSCKTGEPIKRLASIPYFCACTKN